MARAVAARILLLLCVALAVVLTGCDDGGTSTPSASPTPLPRFEEGTCAVPPPEGQDPAAVRCGLVMVPERRGHDNGRLVRLPVMVLEAAGADPAPDPIVYLSGGPGVSALQNDLAFFGNWLDLALQTRRDIILFDLRGTGASEPSLACDEDTAGHLDRLAERLTVDEEYDATEANALACRDRLTAAGIDLGAYDSAANAADMRDIMAALGYDTWNVYAFSYGTRVALSAMVSDDGRIRSVVMDSPSAPAESGSRAAGLQKAVEDAFAACERSPACAAAYPDLSETLDRVLETLDQTPVRLQAQDGASVLLTAERFVAAIFRQFTMDFVARLPSDIYAIADGATEALQPYADVLAAGWSGVSSGVLISTACRERVLPASQQDADRNAQGVRTAFLDGERLVGAIWPISIVGGGERFSRAQRFCEAWGAEEAPAASSLDVEIPALILSGEFDAGEPPAHGEAVASGLRSSRFLLIGNSAHGQGFTYPLCAGAIAAAFFEQPGEAPDTACLSEVPPIDWVLP